MFTCGMTVRSFKIMLFSFLGFFDRSSYIKFLCYSIFENLQAFKNLGFLALTYRPVQINHTFRLPDFLA